MTVRLPPTLLGLNERVAGVERVRTLGSEPEARARDGERVPRHESLRELLETLRDHRRGVRGIRRLEVRIAEEDDRLAVPAPARETELVVVVVRAFAPGDSRVPTT